MNSFDIDLENLSAEKRNKLPYRQGVYALILNQTKNSILMVLKKNSGVWDFPGGGIDEGEDTNTAVTRELLEELGTDKFKVLHSSTHTYRYDWPPKEIEKNIKKSGKLMRGQEQNFVILEFTGNDNEINLQEEELEKHKWIELTKIKDYMVYPDLYEHIKKVLSAYQLMLD